MVRAIVGANWGDEGKGKITDLFAGQSDIVIRFQGGANAGHTIINEHGRFAFPLMPSGVCYDHTTCIIGNGVALDINKFCKELDDVKKAGLNPKLLVSERAQILMPYHILLDEYEEERLGKNAFGSTKSGIAPFFSDKYAKIGIQVNELFDDETLKAKLKNICTLKNLTIKYVYNKARGAVGGGRAGSASGAGTPVVSGKQAGTAGKLCDWHSGSVAAGGTCPEARYAAASGACGQGGHY